MTLAVLATVLVACTPPSAPTLPVCPARVDVLLEAPDPVNFSLPRAVSPDGTWVALSRIVGDDVELSVRRTDAGSSSEPLGSIPYADTGTRPPSVSVAADGARVLWAGNVRASLPDQPTSPLHRWVRATGAVETVTPPAVVAPPPGTPYPVNLRELSADGERAIWTQAFYQGAGEFRFVRSITHTGTDALLAQYEPIGGSYGRISTGGQTLTTSLSALDALQVVDLDTNTVTPLADALAAAQAAYPGGGFQPVISSDDGRYTVLQRSFVTPLTVVLWDHQTDQLSLIAQGPVVGVDTVDDTGTVVYSVDTGPSIRSVHRSVDGTERTVADAPMQASWPENPVVSPLTSADRRTSIYSEPVPVLGNRLVARRCQ